MGYIYKITNLVNNKIYIGQTKRSLHRRWYEHIYNANNNNSYSAISQAIHKYGETNFEFSILEQCDDELLDEKEIKYIQQYHSMINENGYNLNQGGCGNTIINRTLVSDLWRQGLACCDIAHQLNSTSDTICAIIKDLFPNEIQEIKQRSNLKVKKFHEKPILQYDEFGNLLARFSSITAATEQYGSNISRACIEGIKAHGYYWCYDDGIDYISNYIKGPHGGEKKYKSVSQYDLKGNFIQTFPSLRAATAATKVSHIGDVCNGKRKTAGGFLWKWADS